MNVDLALAGVQRTNSVMLQNKNCRHGVDGCSGRVSVLFYPSIAVVINAGFVSEGIYRSQFVSLLRS